MPITDITTGQVFATVSDAIGNSAAGDVIQIPAGTYAEDFPKIRHSLTLQGVGGLAHLVPAGTPSNGQGILVIDAPDVVLDHLELSGAAVPDGNGAGVRFETGTHLTITNSWLHDNQDGLLANSGDGVTITIDRSEFNDNGAGDGYTHNLYVNIIAQLTITGSYFHDALGGHEIKSRALATTITGNRIADGPTAETSYSVDLPNGGVAMIAGNVIEKGPNAPNSSVLHFGGEAFPVHAGSALAVTGNVVINDRPGTPNLLLNQALDGLGAAVVATVSLNTLYGIDAGQFGNALVASGNLFPGGAAPAIDTSHPFSIACFAAGTRIATPAGWVAVEALRVGQAVVSAFGGTAPVVWIGHRRVQARRHAEPAAVWPVRVRAGAFAPGVPGRDVLLSRDHAVLVRGAPGDAEAGAPWVLISIRYLVNGASIAQEPTDTVTYFHVELPAHDVVLAEGLPCESYLDTGNRGAFANAAVTAMQPADFARGVWQQSGCAELAVDGPMLVAAKARLLARAATLGHVLVDDADPLLHVGGTVVRPQRVGTWLRFLPPPGHAVARLRSRVMVPAQVDPASGDCRRLGVAVAAMTLDRRQVAVQAIGGDGWHAPEAGWRWTDGDALIELAGARELLLRPGPRGRYWAHASARAVA